MHQDLPSIGILYELKGSNFLLIKFLDDINSVLEKHFRDFFKTNYKAKKWNAISEEEGRKDYESDFRVIIPKTLFRITMEFKIWNRNFDKYDPVDEILGRMEIDEKKGIIFMINENLTPIEEKLQKKFIQLNKKYIPGSIEELKFKERNKSIFLAQYKNNAGKHVKIYYIMYGLFNFWETPPD